MKQLKFCGEITIPKMRLNMTKYILHLTAEDPENNIELECSTAQEATEYKRKAIEQGYKVAVRKEK